MWQTIMFPHLAIFPPGDIRRRSASLCHAVQRMASPRRNWTRQALVGSSVNESKVHTILNICIAYTLYV